MNSLLALAALLISAPARAQFSGQTDRTLVLVNGTPIRRSEVVERLWRLYGPQTLNEMINTLLMRQAAAASGVKPDPVRAQKMLDKARAEFPSAEDFQRHLDDESITEEDLKNRIAEQLAEEEMVIRRFKLAVSEAEIEKAFAAHRGDLGTPAAVHVEHIRVKSGALAQKLASQINAGADFAALARQYSLDINGKTAGGNDGFVARGVLAPELDAAIFAMKVGEARALKSGGYYDVLGIIALRSAVPATLSASSQELRDALLQEKIERVLPQYIQELRQKADIEPQGD